MALQKAHDQMALSLLKSQVNPHFLMNTLYNIYATVKDRSPEGGQMLLQLGNLLQYGQQAMRRDSMPLGQELDYLAAYIQLQQVRLSDQHHMRFNRQISNPDIPIAPMLLINFVKNAFKHGLGEMTERGHLYIDVALQGNELFFVAENTKPSREKITMASTGNGLANVRQRLQLLYPNRHRLYIADTGTTYTVTLEIIVQ